MTDKCTGRQAVPHMTTWPPAVQQTVQPPAAEYKACTAAELTGRPRGTTAGTGWFFQFLIITNRGAQPCTLAGGPTEITGVREGGRQVILAAQVTPTNSLAFDVDGPANLRPGRSAEVIIYMRTWCKKALEGRANDFAALDIGIARTGHVRANFPPGRPFDAFCSVGVTTFGTHRYKS